jgi:hypothetical protein
VATPGGENFGLGPTNFRKDGYRELELSSFAVTQLAKMLRDFKDRYYKRWHGELVGTHEAPAPIDQKAPPATIGLACQKAEAVTKGARAQIRAHGPAGSRPAGSSFQYGKPKVSARKPKSLARINKIWVPAFGK